MTVEITKYYLKKRRCSTSQNMPKKERNIGRTYRSDNEKRKINSIENEVVSQLDYDEMIRV